MAASVRGHDSRSLLMQAGRDGVVLFGQAPGAFSRVDDHGWLVLTGEHGVDFNMAAVLRSASTSALDRYVDEIESLGLDAILLVDEGAPHLSDAARGRGLTSAGTLPVMVWSADSLSPRATSHVVRCGGERDVRGANAAVAEAFSLDEAAVQRVAPGSIVSAGVDVWVVDVDGAVAGTGLFVRSGDHVGVYSMATRHAYQRRGIGRAVLETAMRHYLDQGVTTFTLEATAAGLGLYDRVGFTTAAEPSIFVMGASTQFPRTTT